MPQIDGTEDFCFCIVYVWICVINCLQCILCFALHLWLNKN